MDKGIDSLPSHSHTSHFYDPRLQVNTQQVSAFTTASSIKLLLLHTGNRSEESIRSFFHEVYELYVKVGCKLFLFICSFAIRIFLSAHAKRLY
jgi:hypothetical protein